MSKTNAYILTTGSVEDKKLTDFFGWRQVYNPLDADVVIFPDEHRDINEAFYGRIPKRGESTKLMKDAYLMRQFVMITTELNVPIVAFGSGALLVSMACGAEMWTLHSRRYQEYPVKTYFGTCNTKCSNIQLMNPYTLPEHDYGILAYSEPDDNQIVYVGENKVTTQVKEIEAVYYNYFNALCIQSSPHLYKKHKTYQRRIATWINVSIMNKSSLKKFYI